MSPHNLSCLLITPRPPYLFRFPQSVISLFIQIFIGTHEQALVEASSIKYWIVTCPVKLQQQHNTIDNTFDNTIDITIDNTIDNTILPKTTQYN